MKVKICGITNLDDALAACEAGADALGFNFAPEARKRNRFIDPEAARKIIEFLPPFVTTVAVCVNDSPEHLLEYLTFVDWVQLHGEETVEQCEPVAKRAIKVFRAAPGFEPESVLAYPTASYLIDAYVPDARGGTGETCDWELARCVVALGRPVFLAGGLTPDNVAEAVRQVRPYGVDTAGGVEASPGLKDRDKMRNFIRHAKTAFLS